MLSKRPNMKRVGCKRLLKLWISILIPICCEFALDSAPELCLRKINIRSAEESDDEIARSQKAPKQRLRDTAPRLRHELDQLLAQPLMARGVSAKYPTSGSRVVIDDLLASKSKSSRWRKSRS